MGSEQITDEAEAPTSGDGVGESRARRSGGVQSLARAFNILEVMADGGGVMGLSQIAARTDLSLPTIHRLVRTLVDLGYIRQDSSRQYALGPRLMRLGETSSRLLGTWARPYMAALVDELGETANLAMLDGDQIVYVGQVPSRHSMRMFTEVGRRVDPHSTAVGKALLAELPDDPVLDLLQRTGMDPQTERTITTPSVFTAELARVRAQGYAIDDEEQEIGVRCVAVAVPDVSPRIALSVSGPTTRMTEQMVKRAVPSLSRATLELSRNLASKSLD